MPIRTVTPDEAVKTVRSGDHVHLSSVATAPQCLVQALCHRGRAGGLSGVHIHHLHTEGPAPYAAPEFEGIFQLDSFFVGPNVRTETRQGFADYIPVFLGETQKLYRQGYLPCDVAMIQVCPPDDKGMVSLGTSVDATLAAIEVARTVIAVVNPHVPRTFGDALIEDGATLQLGIGAIPNAVLSQLGTHKDLGIHTEMFADGVIGLVKKGVINGAKKAIDPHKMVATFLLGSRRLYDYTHENRLVLMKDVGYTNDPFLISRNPKATAINSALQVDLTGQICADSIGTSPYSGVGGQVDFFYGASRSPGGKAILAMPSVTSEGISKIAPILLPGAGVVTTRAHAHWVVTEYGAVNLYGRSLQERAKLLTSIAHPEHREALDRAAFERFGPHFHFMKKLPGRPAG